MSVQIKEAPANSDLILETLAKILDSVPFRSSKQCQDLLRYVVEHSLRQDNEALKERVIGCEVFGRRPDYDTADDPVVRVRAGDVRKRLALYYRTMPHNTPMEIDIPHGSYRVVFRPFQETHSGQGEEFSSPVHEESPAPESAPASEQNGAIAGADLVAPVSPLIEKDAHGSNQTGLKKKVWFLRYPLRVFIALMAVAVLLTAMILLTRSAATAFDVFWKPILASQKGPIIYIGSSAVYRTTDNFADHYASKHGLPLPESEGREFVAKFQPGEKVNADDLIPDRTDFVTIGDTAATSSIVSMLSRLKRSYDLRFGDDIVFGDLRRSPTILIGAFNNSWTIQMDDKLPFVFRPGKSIQEVASGGKSWSTVRDAHGNATEDYALVSRQLHSKSGEFSITIAGIDMTGTRAAAEFVSDPERMNQALKQLPPGWQEKNMQMLLHANIINGLSSATDVVAYRVW
jgi:hypothetical protein